MDSVEVEVEGPLSNLPMLQISALRKRPVLVRFETLWPIGLIHKNWSDRQNNICGSIPTRIAVQRISSVSYSWLAGNEIRYQLVY